MLIISRQLFLKPVLALCIMSMTLPLTALQAGDRAHVWNADDPELEWGPCPDFIPPGCRIAVLQGDPAAHNADVFFKLPPDTEVPLHWHSSAERMILVSGEFEIRYQGQAPVLMRPGSYAYGPARLPHTAHCRAGERCVLFIAFEEPVDAVPGRP